MQVRKSIGPFAAPKAIFVVPDLPKTRSGKIMRRIMRKILAGEEDQLGDTSTVSSTSADSDAFWRGRVRLTSADSFRIHQWWTRSSTLCTRPRRNSVHVCVDVSGREWM